MCRLISLKAHACAPSAIRAVVAIEQIKIQCRIVPNNAFAVVVAAAAAAVIIYLLLLLLRLPISWPLMVKATSYNDIQLID